MIDENLKLCPFCGEKAIIQNTIGFGYQVRCSSLKKHGNFRSGLKEKVVQQWNKRVSDK